MSSSTGDAICKSAWWEKNLNLKWNHSVNHFTVTLALQNKKMMMMMMMTMMIIIINIIIIIIIIIL